MLVGKAGVQEYLTELLNDKQFKWQRRALAA
jgi:hypothetical protein